MYLITWITTHLPTPERWMAELAKARSMQPYIILYKTTLQLAVRNLPKVFTRLGIEPRICYMLIRRSTSKPPSHLLNYRNHGQRHRFKSGHCGSTTASRATRNVFGLYSTFDILGVH